MPMLIDSRSNARCEPPSIDDSRQAGLDAIKRSANAEAVEHLRNALGLLEEQENNDARARQELELQMLLALAQMAITGQATTELERTYLRARELCEQVGDAQQRFSVYRGLWAFYHLRAKYDLARENGQRLLALAEASANSAHRLEANRSLGITWLLLGEFDAAASHFTRGSALYDATRHGGHAYIYGTDPGVVCLSFGAYAHWFRGFPDQALRMSREGQALAESRCHPYSLAVAINFAGHLHSRRREAEAAGEHAERLLALATEHGFAHWSAMGRILCGWAHVQQGRHDRGLTELRQGIAAYQVTGGKRSLSFFLTLLAEAYTTCGLTDDGLSTTADALVAVAESGERHFEAEIYRLKGSLCLMLNRAASIRDAEACFSQSLAIGRRQGARAWQLRTATSLAGLWHVQGNTAHAIALLEPIYNELGEGRQTADMRDAASLLAELRRS